MQPCGHYSNLPLIQFKDFLRFCFANAAVSAIESIVLY
jgi:hypothetical protein